MLAKISNAKDRKICGGSSSRFAYYKEGNLWVSVARGSYRGEDGHELASYTFDISWRGETHGRIEVNIYDFEGRDAGHTPYNRVRAAHKHYQDNSAHDGLLMLRDLAVGFVFELCGDRAEFLSNFIAEIREAGNRQGKEDAQLAIREALGIE